MILYGTVDEKTKYSKFFPNVDIWFFCSSVI